jgi:carbonic anhydrase
MAHTNSQVCYEENGTPYECDTALNYRYEALEMRALYNTGLGVQIAGNFGNVTFPNTVNGKVGVFDVKQFHIHMPAEHQIGDDVAVGELHIVHQLRGSRGTDDLVMISIMLRLPREHEELVGTEPFFMSLGLENIPSDGGHTLPFDHKVDLNVFEKQLQGHFYAYRGSITTPPCHENVQWYVMATPAVISGSNVVAFKSRFPDPLNARERQKLGDRQILTDELLEYKPFYERLMAS